MNKHTHTRITRVSDSWQEWYSESSIHEPDEVDKREISRQRWRRRGKPSSAVLDPGDRKLGTTTITTTITTTTFADDALETSSTPGCKTAASKRTGCGGTGCDCHRHGEVGGGRQGIAPGADRSSGKPNGGRSTARSRRRGGCGAKAAKNVANRAKSNTPRRRAGATGKPNTAAATSHRSRRTTPNGDSRGDGNRQGEGEEEREEEGEEEEVGGHQRWSGRGGRPRVSAAAAVGGANQEVVAAGGERQHDSSRGSNHRGSIGGAGGGDGGRRTSPKESGGGGGDLRTPRRGVE